MIFTERKITVRKGKSSIDEPVILYRGDYEVELRFTIMESKYRFKSGVNLVDSEKASHAQLALLAPDGTNVFTEVGRCEDGTAIFVLSKEMIDELSEVGLYSFQIRLFDYYRESRITIPPIEFGIEVREPIAAEDHINAVDQAIVGYSIAKTSVLDEPVPETFDDNEQYNKTDWETGDRISEGKLNKIEDAIDKINRNEISDVSALDKKIDSNFNALNSTKMDINDVNNKVWSMVNMGQDVKEAMTGGSVAVVGPNAVSENNIVDGAVTYNKTTFFKATYYNLIDKNKVSAVGYAMTGAEPESRSSFNIYRVTDMIAVEPGVEYYMGPKFADGTRRNHHNVAVYDSSQKFIRLIEGGWTSPIIFNEGEHFARFTINHDIENGVFLFNGPIGYGAEEPESKMTFNDTLNTAIAEEARKEINEGIKFDNIDGISREKSVNLIDPEKIVRGYIFDSDTGQGMDSTEGWSTVYGMTDFLEVIPGMGYNYYRGDKPSSLWIAFYDEIKTCIKVVTKETDWERPGWVMIPEGCKYVRLTIDEESYDIGMFISDYDFTGDYIPYNASYNIDDKDIHSAISEVKKATDTVGVDALDFLDYKLGKNLYDPAKGMGDNTAVHSSNGSTYTAKDYTASGYIPVEPGKQYYCSERHNMAMYDKYKACVYATAGAVWACPLTIPDDVYYIRVTFTMAHATKMFVEGTSLPPYEPYAEKVVISDEKVRNDLAEDIGSALSVNILSSKLDGLTWNVLGDSITSTDYSRPNWWEVIAAKHNMTVNGYGISGTTLCHHDERHLWDYKWGKLDATTIGYVKDDPATWSTGNCMVERYVKMADNADIITVMGGTNDGMVPLGNPNDTVTNTFYGGCNVLFKGLIEKYPDKIVAVFTPIQASTGYNGNIVGDLDARLDALAPTATGIPLQLRAEVIKRVARKYGLPVLDLYNESGINGVGDRTTLLYRPNDTLHPSVTGNEWMARVIENFLLNLL